jgi:endoglucanase
MTCAALASVALIAACGGGDASPPLDIIPPSLAISDNVSATNATGPVTFTFTFSEPVRDFDASDIVVTGGTAGEFTLGATNRSATLVVTPGASTTGILAVSVAAGQFTDLAGNASTAAASANQAFDTRTVTPPPPPPTANLVANGDFENGATGWIGNAVDVRTEGGNSFNFANVTAVGNPFDVNISYPLSIPTQGVRYRLTFTASSDRNRTLIAGIGLNEGDFSNASETVNLTTTSQPFTLELTSNFASANSRVLFDMGAAIGTVVIDNVVLEVITTTPPPPPPPPPPAANLVANGDFENGATGWSGNALDVRTEGGNSFNFADVAVAGQPFNVNLSYVLPIPTQGVRYRLTFTASSSRNRTMIAGIGLNEGDFSNASETVNLTTTSQPFTLELTSNFASANSRVLFDMGADTGTVVIDNVVLEVITTTPPPPPPPPPPAANLVANGDFENGATGWSGNALDVRTEGGNSFNFADVAVAGPAFNVNLSYVLPIPTQGVRYRLTFTASSSRNRTMIAGIGLNEGDFTAATATVNLTTTPQTFVSELTANFASNNSRVLFDMGADTGTVVIDNVVLEVIPSVAPAGPATAAPAPIARAAGDVRSVFSDSFTNLTNVDFNPDFGPNARIEDAVIAGNNTKYIDVASGEVFGGISFTSSKFDASTFTHFSVDYWVASPPLPGQVLDIKLSNHDGVDSETSAIQFTVAPVVGGAWQRLNIPLDSFSPASAPASLSRNAIAQIVITAARADVGQPVRIYFDNMHFYR